MEEVKHVIDTFLNVAQVHQGQTLHVATEKHEQNCFHHAMEHGIRHFGEGQVADKKSHLLNSYFGIQHHFEDLKHSLLHMNRENEHFMWDHRTKQYSTILVAATIMISALVAALGQGVLHEDSPDLVVMLYSVTTSLSLAFLFICDVLCIEVIRRGSSFMRHRMSSYRRSLTTAIKKTKEMVHTLRGIDPKHVLPRQQSPDEEGNIPIRIHRKLGKTISHMTDEEVDEEFFNHEIDIQRHHDTEATIIESSFPIANGLAVTQTFEEFWQENCHTYGLTIILLFYAGSIMMIFANLCFMWATYEFKYQSLRGSEVCLHMVTNVVLVTCAILIYMRYEQLDLDCTALSHQYERVGLEDYSWGSIDFVTIKKTTLVRFREVFSSLSLWFMSNIRWWQWQQPHRPENGSLSSQARGHGHAVEQGGYGSIEMPVSRERSPRSSTRSNQPQQQPQPQHRAHHGYFAIPTTEEHTISINNSPTTDSRSTSSTRRRVNQVDNTGGPQILHDHRLCDPTDVNLITSFTSLQPPATASTLASVGVGIPSHTTNPSIVTSSSSTSTATSSSASSVHPSLAASHHDHVQHPAGSSSDRNSGLSLGHSPLSFPSIPYDETKTTSASSSSSSSSSFTSSAAVSSSLLSSSSSSRENNLSRLYHDHEYTHTNRQPSTGISLVESSISVIPSATVSSHAKQSMDSFPPNNAYEEVTYSVTTINKQKVIVKRSSTSSSSSSSSSSAAASSSTNPPTITTLSDGHHLSSIASLTPQNHTFQPRTVDDDYDHAEVSSETSSNFSRGSNKSGVLWSAVKMPIHTSHRIIKSNKYHSTTTSSSTASVAVAQTTERADSVEDYDDWGAQFLFN